MKVVPIEVTYITHCGSDLSTVNAARVSFDKEVEEVGASDEKLIHYLAKHKHLSPFNHCFISVRVKAPIFVARQLVKHEYMPWNEVSRRYVDNEPEFYIPDVWRGKSSDKKQGSSEEAVTILYQNEPYMEDVSVAEEVYESTGDALRRYKAMLLAGVCPEQARMILPQNVMTEWIWSGTLGAFAKMLGLRLDPHTQKETRDVAELIYPIVKKHFPISLQALLDNK
jgi:thymidylate synthase (FAD)